MDGVGVSEQVVQIAQDLLVGADQERPEHVRRVIERMQQQRAFDVPPIDEVVDLAVRVARDVGQHRRAGGPLVEPVNRHDRKQLIDRPAVRQRLEHGEIAEVRVAQQAIELRQFLRHIIHGVHHPADLAGDGPEQVLGQGALFQRQVAGAEQIDRRIEPLLGVVKRLEDVARFEFIQRVVEIANGLRRRRRAPSRESPPGFPAA